MVRDYRMPRHLFDDVIAGQRQDLEPEPFDTFAQLHAYCYRVAGVVGLASIYIWGFEGGAETQQLAVERGVAFQLTNILRDLREDAARGRTYLPAEELARFGATEADLRGRDGTKPVPGPDAVPDRPGRGVLHEERPRWRSASRPTAGRRWWP